ncbi:MAG: NAD(P)/FAD-dependent oxidoreductase [Paraclostridium sp.]
MKYVVLGASAAGINSIKALRDLDKNSDIVLISKDKEIYSRCMLHHVIANHKSLEAINFAEENFEDVYNVQWIKDTTVVAINSNENYVELSNENEKIYYDKLLIATGASSAMPPIKNLREANFVYGLRNIEDVDYIKDKLDSCKKIAILGAGLVGIDALVGLLEYGKFDISVIYREPFILNRQLDEYSAGVYEDKFKQSGVRLYPNASVEEVCVDEEKNVNGVRLEDGTFIECDLAIVATGVVPNADFIDTDVINYNRGIIIDENCRTNIDNIFAAGDVVGKNAIWPLAVKQGIVAASNMVGIDKSIDDEFVFRNTMNFLGLHTVSLGRVDLIDSNCIVKIRKDKDGYKKFIIKDNCLQGVIIQGDISYVGVLTKLIKDNIEVEELDKRIFDIGYADFFSIKGNGEFCYNI